MSTGTLIWFNYQKGQGFIENDEGGMVIVHYSAIEKEDYYRMEEGQRVNFDVKQSRERVCALNVTAIPR